MAFHGSHLSLNTGGKVSIMPKPIELQVIESDFHVIVDLANVSNDHRHDAHSLNTRAPHRASQSPGNSSDLESKEYEYETPGKAFSTSLIERSRASWAVTIPICTGTVGRECMYFTRHLWPIARGAVSIGL